MTVLQFSVTCVYFAQSARGRSSKARCRTCFGILMCADFGCSRRDIKLAGTGTADTSTAPDAAEEHWRLLTNAHISILRTISALSEHDVLGHIEVSIEQKTSICSSHRLTQGLNLWGDVRDTAASPSQNRKSEHAPACPQP